MSIPTALAVGEWKPSRNNKKALRRRVSVLQGASWPDYVQHGLCEHSASSLPAESLLLVWREAGSMNNRASWNISEAPEHPSICA